VSLPRVCRLARGTPEHPPGRARSPRLRRLRARRSGVMGKCGSRTRQRPSGRRPVTWSHCSTISPATQLKGACCRTLDTPASTPATRSARPWCWAARSCRSSG
jgi:hypothetical protein